MFGKQKAVVGETEIPLTFLQDANGRRESAEVAKVQRFHKRLHKHLFSFLGMGFAVVIYKVFLFN
jgi:hypothetical protein